MSNPQTQYAPARTSSVLGGQVVGRSERQAVAPPAALKLRLDLNLEVEIAIQAKVNGDITLSLLLEHSFFVRTGNLDGRYEGGMAEQCEDVLVQELKPNRERKGEK
ncbi:uncharacterized protein ARMOST_19630 [Armillaria ostoyae]|uniref:Uncharacterized protein n=1 Tax=Armillaria ostoyae TaxID=47428 RepID=A0A284S526_ARMOS|nr:uncharacterized protein ARMOST_19630 [Armillaria ostoyae]